MNRHPMNRDLMDPDPMDRHLVERHLVAGVRALLDGRVRFRGGRRSEDGAVAIVVALCLPILVVVAAMVVDFGLVRVDRQVDKSAADAAALAGVHGLDVAGQNGAQPYPYVGICAALNVLKVNDARFAAISSTSGWSNGLGTAVGDGCSDATLRGTACDPADKATWGQFEWSGSYQGTSIEVGIHSGYQLPASGSSGWSEDTLPAAQAFADDGDGGCNQVEVEIHQSRNPTLGSIATSSQLVSSIRSVGRVYSAPGGDAPALLLLRRTGCPVLMTGSNSAGYIAVKGAISSSGRTQPGTIHADSDGSNCSGGSGANIFDGRFGAGIVAYAAPLATNPAAADPTKPGSITSYAASLGKPANVVRDANTNVCGAYALYTAFTGTACSSTKTEVTPGSLVTRTAIDGRYLPAVNAIVAAAAPVWSLTAANAPSYGYAVMGCTDPPPATATAVFVNCATFKQAAAFSTTTKTVVFNGVVNPQNGATISLPAATKVYIFGQAGGNAISLGGGSGGTFRVHTAGNTTSGVCNSAPTGPDPGALSSNKAVVVVKSGQLNESASGTLQMCYTTAVMMGNGANACLTNVPSQETNGPTATPCSTGAGDGQINQQGGNVDWTAPNQYDVTILPDGTPDPAKSPGWSDPNGPEDLALWSESYGAASNPKFTMTGGGTEHVIGVFMTPNADPFQLSGGATLDLTNAQFVAASFALGSANTNLIMSVDPNSAVQLPQLRPVGLVR